MLCKRDRKAKAASRQEWLDRPLLDASLAEYRQGYNVRFTLTPMQAFGFVGAGWFLLRQIRKRQAASRYLAKCKRIERDSRLGARNKRATAKTVDSKEALDQLLAQRIDAGYRYERTASRDPHIYQPLPSRNGIGLKRAKLANKPDTRNVRVRKYSAQQFNPKTGGFGVWQVIERKPMLSPKQIESLKENSVAGYGQEKGYQYSLDNILKPQPVIAIQLSMFGMLCQYFTGKATN